MRKDKNQPVAHAPRTICFQSAPIREAVPHRTLIKITASSELQCFEEVSKPS